MIDQIEQKTKNTQYKGFTIEEIKEKFEYNPQDGELYWKHPHKRAGQVAGSKIEANGGYVYITLGRNGGQVGLLGHRIVWAFIHGEFPPEELFIDHINGDTGDNRPENLRLTTARGNSKNKVARKVKVNERYVLTSTPGIKFDKQTMQYVVSRGDLPEERTFDFDDAKYLRWDWEYDNGYHVLHGIK